MATVTHSGQSGSGSGGTGDVSTLTSVSVDGEIALFSGTGGKVLKRATTTGLLKAAAGVLTAAAAGTDYYNPGGTDVAVADGGTGASTASAARTNLGLVPGTDVEVHDADLTAIAGLDSSTSGAIASDGAGWIKKTYAQFKTALGLVKADVGLGNVTNDAQLKAADLDTDGTLAANSDTKIASQKAVKTYADTKQPLDSDLTTIAGLTATTDNFMVANASAWASRTPTQARTSLGLGAVALLSTVTETDITLADNTTNNVTSTKHGFAPKSGADATTFLNGAATPTYAAVKDSDLSTSDITTNNATTSKHGFVPKLSNVSSEYFSGTGVFSVPAGAGDMVLASVQTITGAKTFGTIGGAVGKLILAGSTSGSTILNAAAVAGTTTITLPGSTDTLVGLATTDTLTNKTLTSPIINQFSTASGLGAAWSTWSPTLTNITAGNGTTSAKYIQIGKTVYFRFKFTLGSTSAIGTNPSFTLPVAINASYAVSDYIASGGYLDSGLAQYPSLVDLTATANTVRFTTASAPLAATTATAPFTWTTNDNLSCSGSYETT